jgi:anti-anti-sigma factor
MDKALTIRVRHERGYAIVSVAGEIDIATVAQLRERLFGLATSGCPLVADLDQVSFIDAAGLGVLVGGRVPGAGGRVKAYRPRTFLSGQPAEGSFLIPSHWSFFASYVACAVAGTRRGDAGAGHQGAGWRHRLPGTAGR